MYEAVKGAMWQIQLAPKKDSIKNTSIKREDNEREFKKSITKASLGGYMGMQGAKINDYVRGLI